MQQKTINVSGRKVNKLEEMIGLLAKLNEDHYNEEERGKIGYPIRLILLADGSGQLSDWQAGQVYRFDSLKEAEDFLKAGRKNQMRMAVLKSLTNKENE